MMTIEQAAKRIALCLIDDPMDLGGFLNHDYAETVAEALTVISGTRWIVLGHKGNYSLHTLENVDVKAKLKGE